MRMISLRRLLSKLTCLALSAQPVAASASPSPGPLLAASDDDDDFDLDDDLPIDREHVDPRQAAQLLGQSLTRALDELRPLAATELATRWALSADPLRRIAIAHALDTHPDLVGARTILEHLTADPDGTVREAASRARPQRS
jgi:hypothetical protein